MGTAAETDWLLGTTGKRSTLSSIDSVFARFRGARLPFLPVPAGMPWTASCIIFGFFFAFLIRLTSITTATE